MNILAVIYIFIAASVAGIVLFSIYMDKKYPRSMALRRFV
jgi:hypothetical protein